MIRYALDLTKYWSKRQHGDITSYLSWFGPEQRPALVLIPTYRQSVQKTTPCVVPLDHAWKWDERLGDPEGCARTCMEFAGHLGLDPLSKITCMRICSIIRDSLGDLVSIPPKPTERTVAADAIITDASGRQRHAEIIDHV